MRREACEACDLSAVERAELGDQGQQGAGDDRSEACDGAQALLVRGQPWGVVDQVSDRLVEALDVLVEKGDLFIEEAGDGQTAWGAAAVLGLDAGGHQMLAMTHEAGQGVALSVSGFPSG